MLVLTRKPGERIVVGKDYEIEVLSVTTGVVKFAFYVDQPLTLMPGNVELDLGGVSPVKLTRKVDDSVIIGRGADTEIEILVVSVKGEAVRVGIKAPRDVQIHRYEVWEAIEKENIAAAKAPAVDLGQIRKLMKDHQQPAKTDDDDPKAG